MAEGRSATGTGNRTDAASIIAELWAEREQARSTAPASSASSPSSLPSPRPPRAPRPKADGRQRWLAVAIVLLLIGAVSGAVATSMGVIGARSKASFLAEADVVCAATNGGVNAISKPLGYAPLAAAATTLVTTTEAQLGRLRALELPGRGDRAGAREVFAAMAATTDAGRSLQTAAGSADAAGTAAASRSLGVFSKDALAKARGYGFTACVAGTQTGVEAVIAGADGQVKDSFLVSATRLCTDFLAAAEAVPPIRNADDAIRYLNASTALVDKLATDLRALPVTPGDEATVAEMIAAVDTMSGTLKQMGVAGVAGDLRRIDALQKELDTVGDQVNAKFENYGLRACGSTA